MIIKVRFPASDEASRQPLPPTFITLGSSEVVLIELQGELDASGDHDYEVVGTLSLEIPDRPRLTIGHHLLEGKIMNLPKSLAVLSRNDPIQPPRPPSPPLPPTSSPIKPSVNPEDGMETGDENSASYDVVAIVKKKIVFAKRPVPIVGEIHAGAIGLSTSR